MVERKAIIFAVKNQFAIGANGETNVIESFFEGSKFKYSVPYNGRGLLKAISIEDEKKIPAFTQLIGISHNSPDWDTAVSDFWADYTYGIPFGEIKPNGTVEGGVEIDGSYIEENGIIRPVEIQDYILYNLLIKDNTVAKDKSLYEVSKNYYVFMLDSMEEKRKQSEIIKQSQTLIIKQAELLNGEDSVEKMRLVVSILGKQYSPFEALTLKQEDCVHQISIIVKDSPESFLKLVDDKNLKQRSLIVRLLDANIIRKDGTVYFKTDDNSRLGEYSTLINYLRSESSKNEVEVLLNKLESHNVSKVLSADYLADITQ